MERLRGEDVLLVGRDAERLTALGGESRVAGLDEPERLTEVLRGCAVVVNCVAPFGTWGERVVRAAIAAGVHYVDISGEQAYLMHVFEQYGRQARDAGVTVVPMVNDGGFLVDLLAGAMASRLDRIEDVVVAHRFTGDVGLSRGSGRSALANLRMFRDGGLVHTDGRFSDGPVKTSSITFPGDAEPSPVGKFALPEVATIPRHVHARRVEAVAEADLIALFDAVTADMVEALPENPGRDGGFVLLAEMTGERRLRGVVEGTDPYGTTAVVAAEAARRLAAGAVESGVLAPAQAFDPVDFLDSLAPHGVSWSIS
ncbi:saccharopine dehydrogenase NADP-binding domain-containing protein [Actinosynnema sp. CS-041913]|uniref:saccharopine dehydrogenase NADP-binding domain-containing protein n=1 Tax=Actinosynnema sp. CS-041913 TaxID=3239917 RepID=UPI003D8F7273